MEAGHSRARRQHASSTHTCILYPELICFLFVILLESIPTSIPVLRRIWKKCYSTGSIFPYFLLAHVPTKSVINVNGENKKQVCSLMLYSDKCHLCSPAL